MAQQEKEAKLKALQLTMEKLDKTFGKGAVMKLGDNPVEKVDVIPTGSLTLDLALGINGYPKGRHGIRPECSLVRKTCSTISGSALDCKRRSRIAIRFGRTPESRLLCMCHR